MRLPTPLEVRQKIEAVGDTIHPTENRRVAKDVDEYQLQMAMKYEYIVAGRVAEIAGKYQPETDLAYPVYINGIESLLIPVKTAKHFCGNPIILVRMPVLGRISGVNDYVIRIMCRDVIEFGDTFVPVVNI